MGWARRERPAARITGFCVQPMVRLGRRIELIAGIAEDPTFGPVVVFGRGGTAVEVVDDRALALPPLDLALADELIGRTRVARRLAGYRDVPPADRAALALILVKLAQLSADLPQVPPHYTVKKRLDARLFAAPARRGLGLRGWLAAALTAAAVAVAALVIAPALMTQQADRIAELSVPDRGLRITTAFDTDAGAVEVTLAEGPAPADGDLEVWWISPDAAPVSLGLAPHDGTVTLPLPRDVAAHAADAQGVTIALSSEPRGGSPTGQPTGPVLATAPLTTL